MHTAANGGFRSLGIGPGKRLYAAGRGDGVWRLTGSTWENFTSGLTDPQVWSLAFGPNDLVYCGTYRGVGFSYDQGESWYFTEMGSPIFGLAVGPDGAVYAATYLKGINVSTNGGVDWTRISAGMTVTNAYTVAALADGDIYAGMAGGHVYRLADGGQKWDSLLATGGGGVRTIAMNRQGEIFVVADGSKRDIWRSSDRGANWTKLGETLPDSVLGTLAIDSSDALYLTVPGAGVYTSTDDGDTWSAMNEGLEHLDLWAICVRADSTLAVAREGTGMMYFNSAPDSTSSVRSFDDATAPAATMRSSEDGGGVVIEARRTMEARLQIVDMRGDLLVDRAMRLIEGERSLVSIDGAPSGLYLVRLVGEGQVHGCMMVLSRSR